VVEVSETEGVEDLLLAWTGRWGLRGFHEGYPGPGRCAAVFGLELLRCLVARLFQDAGRPVFALCSKVEQSALARTCGLKGMSNPRLQEASEGASACPVREDDSIGETLALVRRVRPPVRRMAAEATHGSEAPGAGDISMALIVDWTPSPSQGTHFRSESHLCPGAGEVRPSHPLRGCRSRAAWPPRHRCPGGA
jgi:hypothetical protein